MDNRRITKAFRGYVTSIYLNYYVNYYEKEKTMNDKAIFARTAIKTKKVNIRPKIMLGGTRF